MALNQYYNVLILVDTGGKGAAGDMRVVDSFTIPLEETAFDAVSRLTMEHCGKYDRRIHVYVQPTIK